MKACCANANEHVVVTRRWFVDVREFQNIGCAVSFLNDGLHRLSPGLRGRPPR
jgi:hypothetical protein